MKEKRPRRAAGREVMTMTIVDKNGKLKDLHANRTDNLFTAVMEL